MFFASLYLCMKIKLGPISIIFVFLFAFIDLKIPLFPQNLASLVRTRFIEILSPVADGSHLPYYSLVQISTTTFCLFLHANVMSVLAASISSRWTCKFVVTLLPSRNTLSPFLDSPYSRLGLSIFLPWLGQYP